VPKSFTSFAPITIKGDGPMRLFVSYARVDRPFCEQIVRTLETAHEVWYDRRLHAGKKWWNEILKRLDWCEGFIYLLSPESVASEYCQNEYAIAAEQGKLVIPVRIQANTDIPPELLEIQVADFSEGLTAEAVARLLAGITVAEREGLRPPSPARPAIDAPVIEVSESSATFSAALAAYEAGHLDEALFKLMQARDAGYDPGSFVDLDDFIAEVQTRLERQAYLREAEREYTPIIEMVRLAATRQRGCEAFALFQEKFPDFDPEDLASTCAALETVPPPVRPLWLAIGGAALAGLVGVLAITGVLGGGPSPAAEEEPEPGIEEVAAPAEEEPGEVAAPADEEPALAEEEVGPADTPTPVTFEPILAGSDCRSAGLPEIACTGVERNDGWTPVTQEFDGVEMALVPVGCFMMGSEDGPDDERPVHEQCFGAPFWIDVTEVTNEQYGSASEDCLDDSFDLDQPHICVQWVAAAVHCERRGARLPTEAEWEYAARGPDGLVYPWGNDFVADNVVSSGSGAETARVVGSRPRGVSWVGALDLSGNVWEWVSSVHRDYPHDTNDGRDRDFDHDSTNDRVLRGGSWIDGESGLRAANRFPIDPYLTDNHVGFRCARPF